jgi:hypothetical protein
MTRARTHQCAAFGCRAVVPWNQLMCGRCWRLVPRAIQTDVYAAWNGGKRTPAWCGAVNRAIAAVAEQGDLFSIESSAPLSLMRKLEHG